MAALTSVAVLTRIPNLLNVLSQQLPKITFKQIQPDAKNIIESLNASEIIIADFDAIAPHIYNLKKVQWIQGTWAGVDFLMKHYDSSKPIKYPIARFTGSNFGTMMAEYIVSHVVAFERKNQVLWESQKSKVWKPEGEYRIIADMTAGILGTGNIGSYVAKVLHELGAKTWGLVRSNPKTKLDWMEYRLNKDIDELLSNCDLIVNVLPHTKETEGLLSIAKLAKCKEALFVNVGRGSICKEDDLIQALDKGYLRGAILDVFPTEPLPPTSKLWQNPKVILTPHVAAVSRPIDIAKVFKDNFALWENGKPPSNLIDFERGY